VRQLEEVVDGMKEGQKRILEATFERENDLK
jgi:hypothetical protein